MKKLLENKKSLIIIFILEAILLILGICGAMYDDGHASIVILIMAIFVLTVLILYSLFYSQFSKAIYLDSI